MNRWAKWMFCVSKLILTVPKMSGLKSLKGRRRWSGTTVNIIMNKLHNFQTIYISEKAKRETSTIEIFDNNCNSIVQWPILFYTQQTLWKDRILPVRADMLKIWNGKTNDWEKTRWWLVKGLLCICQVLTSRISLLLTSHDWLKVLLMITRFQGEMLLHQATWKNKEV